jgi:hypothetical protein
MVEHGKDALFVVRCQRNEVAASDERPEEDPGRAVRSVAGEHARQSEHILPRHSRAGDDQHPRRMYTARPIATSAEHRKACLSFWTPLVVTLGTKPTGVVGLKTVRRPDGRTQVAYRGAPLYIFYLDRTRGDVGGGGFEDVGVWHAEVRRAA